MHESPIPIGSVLRVRLLLVSAGLSVSAVALIALYLYTLMDLSPRQWEGFAWVVGVLFAPAFLTHSWFQNRLWSPIGRCLDRRYEGRATPADLRVGFEAVSNLPIAEFRTGACIWSSAGVVVAASMAFFVGVTNAFSAAVIVAASTSGGLVMCIIHFYAVKRLLEPVREALALEVGESDGQPLRVRSVPLARKLLVSVTGVTLVLVLFAIFFAEVRSGRSIEGHAASIQSGYLGEVASELAHAGAADLELVGARARRIGIAERLLLLDRTGNRVVAGAANGLSPSELEAIRDFGLERGDSRGFNSPLIR